MKDKKFIVATPGHLPVIPTYIEKNTMTKQEYYRNWFETKRKFIMETQACNEEGISALGVVAQIFDINTYDGEVDRHFARMIMRVFVAIVEGRGTAFQDESHQNYLDYLTVMNLRNIQSLFSWGTSIRGAWFSPDRDKGWKADKYIGVCDGEAYLYINDRDDFKECVLAIQAVIDNEEAKPIDLDELNKVYENDPAAIKQLQASKIVTEINNAIATAMEDKVIQSAEQAEELFSRVIDDRLMPLVAGGLKDTWWGFIRQEPTPLQPSLSWLITIRVEGVEGQITLG